jgi:hypothetical protein
MQLLRRKAWSPYAVGAAIGVLETLALLTAKKPLGITTAFENTAALAAEKLAPQATRVAAYRAHSANDPKIDWEAGLVAGVVLGSLYSSWLSDDPEPPAVPEAWHRKIGPSKPLRYAAAVAGGGLMMFGARMAKGCTSGHGISGSMQFAASSWLFAPIMFTAGAAVTRALFGRKA